MGEATTLLYEFLLDSVDILDYVSEGTKIDISRLNTNGNTADIHVSLGVDTIKVPVVGQSIVISRGITSATENIKFKGNVKKITIREDRYILTCKSEIQQLKHKFFTKSYDKNADSEAGEVSAIFSDIVTNGGFSVSTEDSGTGTSDLVIDKFISRDQTRLNRMNLCARLLGWIFREDFDNDWIRFEPKGFVNSGVTLTVGTNVFNNPIVNVNIENMRNKLKIKGAFDIDTKTENEIGDGSTATFNFTYTPETVECTVDGTLQVLGVSGSTETYDYTIDKDLKTYTFETGSIPGAVAIVMKYTTKIPRPVEGTSPESISTYGLIQEDVYTFDDILTVNDAEIRLNQLLSLLKDGSKSTTVLTNEFNLIIGSRVQYVNPNNSINDDEYVIERIVINYPDPVDSVTIGTEEVDIGELFQTIDERLKSLENQTTGDIGLLRTIFDLVKTITFSRDSFTKTIQKICDSFIVGHKVNGIIGTGTSLDSFTTGNSGNWSGTSFTVSDEATIKLVGANSMKLVWAGGATSGNLTSTQSLGDLSSYTGVSSGTPSQGTIGLWVYVTNATDITDITLRIGSSDSNYTEVSATAYASVDGYENWDNLSFSIQSGWNYLLFDLDNGSETGTPDWTSVDYTRFNITFDANRTIYFEYFTISESNFIGLNGVGSRKMTMS